MKKSLYVTLLITLLAVLPGAVQARVEAWEDNLGHTSQSWDFAPRNLDAVLHDGAAPVAPGFPGRGDGPLLPDATDEDWHNPFGTPGLVCTLTPGQNKDTVFNDPWWLAEKCGRSWCYGGIGNAALIFAVPLDATPGLTQELDIQWIHRETAPEGRGWNLEVGRGMEGTPGAKCEIDDVRITDTAHTSMTIVDDVPLENGWHRVTARVRITAAPTTTAYIKISALREYYFFDLKRNSYISAVSVDSRSVACIEALQYDAPPAPLLLPLNTEDNPAPWILAAPYADGMELSVNTEDLHQGRHTANITVVRDGERRTLPVELRLLPPRGSTFQKWEFNEPAGGGKLKVPGNDPGFVLPPDAKDAPTVNTAGEPVLKYAIIPASMGDWMVSPPMGSWGRTGMYGGMGSSALIFEIPDNAGEQALITARWVVYLKDYHEGGRYVEFGNTISGSYAKGDIDSIIIDEPSPLISLEHTTIEDSTGRVWHSFTAQALVDPAERHYVKLLAQSDITGFDEVTITTLAAAPIIACNVDDIDLVALDAKPVSAAAKIWNAGPGVLQWQAESCAEWLSVTPSADISLDEHSANTITVTANPAGLQPGTYTSRVCFRAPHIAPCKLPVTLTVAAPGAPDIGCDLDELTIDPSGEGSFELWNSGGGSLSWQVTAADQWLSASPAAGSLVGADRVTINLKVGDLAPGTYHSSITITGGDKTHTVPVTVTIPVHTLPPLPDWSGAPDHTRQSWQFNCRDIDPATPGWQIPPCDKEGDKVARGNATGATEYEFGPGVPGRDQDVVLAPDMLAGEEPVPWVNAGTPLLIQALLHQNAGWSHMPMAGNWDHHGVYGGMSASALIFKIPLPQSGEPMELCTRFTFYASGITAPVNGQDYLVEMGGACEENAAATEYVHALTIPETNDMHFVAEEKGRVKDTAHSDTKYWHTICQHWELDHAPAELYVKITLHTRSTATMIDDFALTTRRLADPSIPVVTASVPRAGAADTGLQSPVSLTFSRVMDKDSCAAAFALTAEDTGTAVAGVIQWHDNTLVFTPDAPLDWNTVYRVNMARSARDVTGTPLAQDFSSSFTTRAYTDPEPRVEGLPEQGAEINEETLTLTVGGNNVAAYRYRLTHNGAAAGEWSDMQTSPLVLEGLADGAYTLEIQVADESLTWHEDSIATSFTVAVHPTVVGALPSGQTPQDAPVRITFSEPMDREKTAAALSITPQIGGSVSWQGNTMIFTPYTPWEPGTPCTVTLDATAADLSGLTLAGPMSFSFTAYAGTTTITCPVRHDTYLLAGSMGGGKGYPDKDVLKAGHMVDIRTLIKFNLDPVATVDPASIKKAELCYNMGERTSAYDAMDLGHVAAPGKPMYAFVHMLADTLDWTEEVPLASDAYQGPGVWGGNLPPVIPGAPMALARHAGGKNAAGTIDVTSMVRAWVRGTWPNNGLQISDHNDNAYLDSTTEMDSGYGWFISSRESANPPCLRVEIEEDPAPAIVAHPAGTTILAPGQKLTLRTRGDKDAAWEISAPDGQSLTNHTGAQLDFTAPDEEGVYTISLEEGADRVFVAVSSRNQETPRQADLFPLFTAEADRAVLAKICERLVTDLGPAGMMGTLSVDGRLCGGTGRAWAARTAVLRLDGTKQTLELAGDDNSLLASITVPAGLEAAYAALCHTGRSSWDFASPLYRVAFFDARGTEIFPTQNCTLTLGFDCGVIFEGMFADGLCSILATGDVQGFFTTRDAHGEDPRRQISAVSAVDHTAGTVTFTTTGGGAFGLSTAKGPGIDLEEADDAPAVEINDMDSGCFIGTARK